MEDQLPNQCTAPPDSGRVRQNMGRGKTAGIFPCVHAFVNGGSELILSADNVCFKLGEN